MFKYENPSRSTNKKSPTKKQLAVLAKGRAIRMRNIRNRNKMKTQKGGAFCPEGTIPFNNGLHCCHNNTDMNDAPLDTERRASTSCKDNKYVSCKNDVDETIPNEICYRFISDVEKNHNGYANRHYKSTIDRLLISHIGQELTPEERAYFENVKVHYGNKIAMITLLDIDDWKKVEAGQQQPRVIQDNISGEMVSITGPPHPVPESPTVREQFGPMPEWAYVRDTAVPVGEPVEQPVDQSVISLDQDRETEHRSTAPVGLGDVSSKVVNDDSSSSSEDDE